MDSSSFLLHGEVNARRQALNLKRLDWDETLMREVTIINNGLAKDRYKSNET